MRCYKKVLFKGLGYRRGFTFLSHLMKKTLFAALAAAAAFCLAGVAHAEGAEAPLYFELGYSKLSVKGGVTGLSLKASPGALSGIAGYQVNDNLSLEGMLAFGLGSSEAKINGVGSGVDTKVGTGLGFFTRASTHLSDDLELFGRLGWQHSRLKFSNASGAASDSGSDLAYGFGVNYNLSKSSYLQASWMSYYNKNNTKISGIGLSYGMRF